MVIVNYIFFGILCLVTLLHVFKSRSPLTGRGVAVTSILLLISVIYILITGLFWLSWILLIISLALPRLFPSLFVSLPIVSNVFGLLVSIYWGIIRIGISKEKIRDGKLKAAMEVIDQDASLDDETKQRIIASLTNK